MCWLVFGVIQIIKTFSFVHFDYRQLYTPARIISKFLQYAYSP